MTGAEIKQLIHKNGLKCWEVAYALGVNDGNFSRKLRKPFDEQQTEQILTIISKLSKAKKKGA